MEDPCHVFPYAYAPRSEISVLKARASCKYEQVIFQHGCTELPSPLRAMYENSCSSTSSMALSIFRFLKNSNLMTIKYFIDILTGIPLANNDAISYLYRQLDLPIYELCMMSSF